MQNLNPLTEKQSKFVQCYVDGDGDGVRAAIAAGYSPKSAKAAARTNLENPAILLEIEMRRMGGERIATFEDRQKLWTQIMYEGGKNHDPRIQLKASELLARSQADFAPRPREGASKNPIEFIVPIQRKEA